MSRQDSGMPSGDDSSQHVVSVQVGLPRDVGWRGTTVSTGIFKEPVDGPVRVSGVNLEGDGQADLTVHGGPDKAVYVYPAEHYPYWREQLGRDLAWGAFGENLTVEGMPLEDELCIGDVLRIGSPSSPSHSRGCRASSSASASATR